MLVLVDHACHSSEGVVSRLRGPGSLVEDSSNFSQGQKATWFGKPMTESDMRTSSWFRRALTIRVRRPSVATSWENSFYIRIDEARLKHYPRRCRRSRVTRRRPPTLISVVSTWKPSRCAWPISSDFWAHCCVNILVGHEFHFPDWVLFVFLYFSYSFGKIDIQHGRRREQSEEGDRSRRTTNQR